MSANVVDVGNLKGWASARKFVCTVGAAALKFGQLCKIVAGVMVTAADNDVPTATKLFVAGGNSDASATGAVFAPLSDLLVAMTYSGGTPTVGVAYGISTGQNIDVTDTTNDCVTVVEVDTDKEIAWVIEHNLSA